VSIVRIRRSTPPEELVVPLAVLDDDQADRPLRVFELRHGV
jgi:ribosomal protein L18E